MMSQGQSEHNETYQATLNVHYPPIFSEISLRPKTRLNPEMSHSSVGNGRDIEVAT